MTEAAQALLEQPGGGKFGATAAAAAADLRDGGIDPYTLMAAASASPAAASHEEQGIDLQKLNEKIDELGEKVNDMTHLQKLYETIAALGEKMDALQNAADKMQTDREVLSAKLDRLVETIGSLQQNIDAKLSVGVVGAPGRALGRATIARDAPGGVGVAPGLSLPGQ
jgi:tetrahydromethanopterin S-methyltransferase subunit B